MPTVEEVPLVNKHQEVFVVDRRRDGRIDYSNPHLIELLRRPESPTTLAPAAPEFKPVTIEHVPSQKGSTMPMVMLTSFCFWLAIVAVLWKVF